MLRFLDLSGRSYKSVRKLKRQFISSVFPFIREGRYDLPDHRKPHSPGIEEIKLLFLRILCSRVERYSVVRKDDDQIFPFFSAGKFQAVRARIVDNIRQCFVTGQQDLPRGRGIPCVRKDRFPGPVRSGSVWRYPAEYRSVLYRASAFRCWRCTC